MIVINPLDETHNLGFLSPFFYANIHYKGRWFANVYSLAKVIGYEESYRTLLRQYPIFASKVRDCKVRLIILGQEIGLEKMCDDLARWCEKKMEENSDVNSGIVAYQNILKIATEYECLAEPSLELLREILLQNKMDRYLGYLDKEMARNLTKKELRIVLELPYIFEVNRAIFHLAHFRKTPTKYSCRQGKFDFRKGPFLPPMKKEEFLSWLDCEKLEEDNKAKVRASPISYSMYDILQYKKVNLAKKQT